MSILPVSFRGRFQVWLYSVSHGQLLLRSTKSADRSTQIDILFINVAAMCLPVAFDGLEVQVIEPGDLSTPPKLGALSYSGRKVYRIIGNDVDAYVVASSVIWDESDKEYDSASSLWCN